MVSRFRSIAVATFAAFVSFSAASGAAPPNAQGVRVDLLQPASPESAFFRTEGPHVPFADGVEFAARVTLEYGSGILKERGVNSAGATTDLATLINNGAILRLGASITPVHWLAFDVALPIALLEEGSAPVAYGSPVVPKAPSAPGVGDLRFGAHVRPIDTAGFGLLVGGRVWAPFGAQETYLSDGNLRGELDVGAAGELGRSQYGGLLSISPALFASRAGDRVTVSGAYSYAVSPQVSLGIEPAFALVKLLDSQAKETYDVAFEPLITLRFRLGGFHVGIAGGPGLGNAPGAAAFRGLVDVGYVGLGKAPPPPPSQPADRDLDGILDVNDACPDEAGPKNADPKLNGCPIRDRDGDGIPDALDACPDKPGIPFLDPKANGCPDTDNDGFPDPIDPCVNEPGPRGCPQSARLTPKGFAIDPPIDFGWDDKLKAHAKSALDEVAATLRANPSVSHVSIILGTKGAKPPSTERRTKDLLAVMAAAKIDPSRYAVVLREDVRGGLVEVRIGSGN